MCGGREGCERKRLLVVDTSAGKRRFQAFDRCEARCQGNRGEIERRNSEMHGGILRYGHRQVSCTRGILNCSTEFCCLGRSNSRELRNSAVPLRQTPQRSWNSAVRVRQALQHPWNSELRVSPTEMHPRNSQMQTWNSATRVESGEIGVRQSDFRDVSGEIRGRRSDFLEVSRETGGRASFLHGRDFHPQACFTELRCRNP